MIINDVCYQHLTLSWDHSSPAFRVRPVRIRKLRRWDGRLWRNVRTILAAVVEVVQKLKWGAHKAKHKWHADFICLFLGVFAQLRKASIASSCLPVGPPPPRPPAHMEELGPPLDGFL